LDLFFSLAVPKSFSFIAGVVFAALLTAAVLAAAAAAASFFSL
jgi:hypothetical protein